LRFYLLRTGKHRRIGAPPRTNQATNQTTQENKMSHHESAATGSDSRMVDRMLFFSDAVFAIVLTILVLELRPPGAEVDSEHALLDGILAMGRHYASFAISFTLGGVFWLAHMRLTRSLKQFDWPTAGANLSHLFTITLLPFAAAILGEHIRSTIAFAVYSMVIILVAFSSAFTWLVATRGGGHLIGGISARRRIAGALRTGAIGIAFAVGLPFILNGMPNLGRFCWIIIIPIITFANKLGEEKGATKKKE
jgi:uncharacterized membrane protein